jgi:hypothetical protein
MNTKDKLKKLRRLVSTHYILTEAPECEYGHFECSCSARNGGPCLDETLGEIERLSGSEQCES